MILFKDCTHTNIAGGEWWYWENCIHVGGKGVNARQIHLVAKEAQFGLATMAFLMLDNEAIVPEPGEEST